ADQVRPLLPASDGCLVLITSRNRLRDLESHEGARQLNLRVLSTGEAHDLLVRHVGAQRVAEDDSAARELAQHCAGLPLALSVAGVRACEFADFSLRELVDELADERDRLDSLEEGGRTGVRAVFSWSYRALSTEAARVFRLLGLPTGPDIDVAAIGALTGLDRRAMRGPL